MEQMASDDSMSPSETHDCCNDADTFAKSGKACKSGQECQSNNHYSAVILSHLMPAPIELVLFPRVEFSLYSFDRPNVWRPPSRI
jgi:hypothetical protein